MSNLLSESLSEITVPLHRMIPFSNVEGIGNRTSIFLQGCSLNCLYCHNPETIALHSKESKAVSLQYLFDKVMEAVPFIRGVTVSGGEPTIHYQQLIPLFKALKQQNLSCYLDSSGFFDFDKIKELIDVTDKFLFDLKGDGDGLYALCFDRNNKEGIVDAEKINLRDHIKHSMLTRNLTNLQRLLALDKVEEVRLVLVNQFFDAKILIQKVAELLKNHSEVTLKIIRMHTKGTRDAKGLEPFMPTVEQTDEISNFAKQVGIAKVITIY